MNHLAFNFHYIYDANGTKLRKYFFEDNRVMETTVDSYMIKSPFPRVGKGPGIGAEGRMKWDDHDTVFYAEYFIKDHLGNVRDVITTNSNYSNPIIQVADYYPFGLEIQQTGASENLQLHNSKELQTDAKLWWYDYGARFYDPVLGRWHSVDSLALSLFSFPLSPCRSAIPSPNRPIAQSPNRPIAQSVNHSPIL